MSAKRILLVDDNKGQRVTLESILKSSGFQVVTADCGNAALALIDKENFAAAVLDIKMPDLTGIDVLRALKENKPDIMVIMMTGYSDTDYAIDALNAGASAYLMKPVNIEQIKNLLKQAIEHQRLIKENRDMSAALLEWKSSLESKVQERTGQLAELQRQTVHLYQELKKNFESTLQVLSIAIDQRDPLTASHSFRVTEYAIELGKLMGLPSADLERLRYAGLMHDLGKIEIKEAILRKEGSLTAEEYREIQTHARGTFQLLSKFKFKRDLAEVPLIASSHHERFDGSGYPAGLKGEAIPVLARILAVADVLDAITSKRHYRSAMSIQNALSIMKREAGGHFDPACIDALFRMSAGNFMRIHMAEHLERLDSKDMLILQPVTLQTVMNACETGPEPKENLEVVEAFYKYYQGPAPAAFEKLIPPAPKFDDEPPEQTANIAA